MTTTESRDTTTGTRGRTEIGAGINRVDGPLKVAGLAPYVNDFAPDNLCHGALVLSPIAAGRITGIDTAAAEAAPGVIAVLHHLNAPALADTSVKPPPPFQHTQISHRAQYLALVIAETAEQATDATRLVHVDYALTDPLVDPHDPRATPEEDIFGSDTDRGDPDAAFAVAEVVIDAVYTTAENTNNPLGLFATIAWWDGDNVTVRDATQGPAGTSTGLAKIFGLAPAAVRVLAPYLGGGFGAGLRVWPHIVATVMAARIVHRPVSVALTRPQMFTGIGHRPNSVQRLKIGALADGTITAVEHLSTITTAMHDNTFESVTDGTKSGYHFPNLRTRERQIRLNIPSAGAMRAPGEAPGNFALETGIDELAYALDLDPMDVRLRNYANVNPTNGFEWSSKALDECYSRGAELVGWRDRPREVGLLRDDNWRIGYGLAGVSFFWWQPPCTAEVTLRPDGTVLVQAATSDIGTGTYTVMGQLAAELLHVAVSAVTVELGDSAMATAAGAGGSGLTAALGNAVADACRQINERRGKSYAAMDSGQAVTAIGSSKPPDPAEVQLSPSGAFAARFAVVRVDADLGVIKVDRLVSVVDAGRVLNEKTARSQIVGGTVGGIGHALFEEALTDTDTGRVANATLADYLVPVNADVPPLEVEFVGSRDRYNGIGVKGVGEIGLVGVAAAIGNAIFHATGKRLRDIPFSLDRLL
ncbi:MAG: xanthine dehydrogenase family protein molybdopterin-binding subunit [Actinomycetota bacterium]|nr:xanthine dehydrogenase family protein molybdopterin-binding subunit [Actinomycetota bacterium]